MLFDYKAVSAEGRMIYGRLDAINAVDLEMRLKRMELDLVTATPTGAQNAIWRAQNPPAGTDQLLFPPRTTQPCRRALA
jgi:type II secretory pathway component PulF